MTVRKGRPEDNPFRRPMVIILTKRPAPSATKPNAIETAPAAKKA
jgi:hypothetical protein